MPVQIQFRRGTAAQWTSANPTLAQGEMGMETDTYKFKIGNGSTAWNSLTYGGLSGDFAAAVSITNATAATSTSTGALKVTGGVGIQGSLFAPTINATTSLVIGGATGITASGSNLVLPVATVGGPAQEKTFYRAGTVTTGVSVLRWYPATNITIQNYIARVTSAPTGSSLNVTVLLNGGSAATLSIPSGSTSSSVNTNTISVTTGQYIQIQVTAVGSTSAGIDLAVVFNYTRST